MKLVLLLVAFGLIIGCGDSPTSGTAASNAQYTESEQRALNEVNARLRDAAVWTGGGVAEFKLGSLRDGTAVLLVGFWKDSAHTDQTPVDACFWVHEGVVYAVDEEAKKLVPDLAFAPTAITEAAILEVAH
jgi:hypothetical protein